jgi:SAM-dependent methyltransferase
VTVVMGPAFSVKKGFVPMVQQPKTEEPPLRIGAPEDFARVEGSLRDAGFEESRVCGALQIPDISAVGKTSTETADLSKTPPALALFVRLFLFFESVRQAEVEQVLDGTALDSFLSLDVLRQDHSKPGHYYCPVFICPVAGLIIASDLYRTRDGSPFNPPPDVVFPALYPGTLSFLDLISKAPAHDAVDLCSGSGIGALVLSRSVKRSTASDITPRATHFARFNQLLNRCGNVDVVCGDLYEAVQGRTFDRIVAHPPYIPAIRNTVIWRDGGDTGEAIVQRVVEGLPDYLRPGGSCLMVCLGLDTREGQFEERARRWLGKGGSGYDIVFGLDKEISPKDAAAAIGSRNKELDAGDIARLERTYQDSGTTKLVYGALAIRRHARPAGEGLTLRARLSDATEGSDLDRLFRWHERRSEPDFFDQLVRAKPRLAPGMQVNVMYLVVERELVPVEFVMKTDKPFASATKIDGWVVPVIAELNGERTLTEVYDMAREASAVPESFGINDFAELAAMLIERGYLELET